MLLPSQLSINAFSLSVISNVFNELESSIGDGLKAMLRVMCGALFLARKKQFLLGTFTFRVLHLERFNRSNNAFLAIMAISSPPPAEKKKKTYGGVVSICYMFSTF